MEIKSDSKLEFSVSLTLTEAEARALHALTVYGENQFLDFFYKNLGTTYLKPHENGLKTLFVAVKAKMPLHLDRIKKTKETFNSKL